MANSTANFAITLMCLATAIFMHSRIAPEHFRTQVQQPLMEQWQKAQQPNPSQNP